MMIDISPENRLSKVPRQLTFVRHLEAFEGPILSEYRATNGTGSYIEKFCASEETTKRYLLVRSEQRAIAEFLSGRLSMRNLIFEASDGVGFVLDRQGADVVAVYISPLASLPRSYFPTERRFHDPELRPEWESIPQSYIYDDSWDGSMFATLERNYLNAAGFAYLTNPRNGRLLPPSILDFAYGGGWSVVHAFNHIRAAVPTNERARPGSIAANSPGVFTIDAPPETADRLSQALRALSRSVAHYQAIHAWSRLDPARIAESPSTMPPSSVARNQIKQLCAALDVDAQKLYPGEISADYEPAAVLVAAKLIAAYYRVLLRVLSPSSNVEFLGVELSHHEAEIERPRLPALDIQEDEPDIIHLRR